MSVATQTGAERPVAVKGVKGWTLGRYRDWGKRIFPDTDAQGLIEMGEDERTYAGEIPNEATLESVRETRSGKGLKEYASLQAMADDLGL